MLKLIRYTLGVVFLIVLLYSCKESDKYNQKPELESLRQGLKTSVAIGYCASIVHAAINGDPLPGNVLYTPGTGLIYIHISNDYPLPFNSNIGDIAVAFLWNDNAGVMTILFADINIIGGEIKLYGLHTIPIIKKDGDLLAIFAKQDIIVGYGSDTILDLSNITSIVFNTEIDRLNAQKPSDTFVAAKQNVWFINIDQNNTNSYMYDDNITITGGGQIAEVKGATGGIIYHAMIDAKVNYSTCTLNPISGYALSQNFKAGGEPYIDLGSTLLSFHNNCDGKAHIDLCTGKYLNYNGKDISLDLY